jgi:DNA-binding CsgD family transcriptional regulator
MNEDTREIVERLDRLANLVAIGLLGGKTQREQIRLLSKGGFPPREIAELVGTTPNTVRVELTSIRKDKKKRKRN